MGQLYLVRHGQASFGSDDVSPTVARYAETMIHRTPVPTMVGFLHALGVHNETDGLVALARIEVLIACAIGKIRVVDVMRDVGVILAPMLLMLLPIPGADILGMMLFIVLLTNRQLVPVRPILVRSMAMVAVFGGVELFNGVFFNRSSGVAHFAHLGGMLGAWLVIQYWRGRLPLGGGPRRR